MTGPVGSIIGPRRAVAAKAALGNTAVRRAAENTAHMLIGKEDIRRILDHNLDSILVAQPV